MKKKLFSFILVGFLIVGLTACGEKSDNKSTDNNKKGKEVTNENSKQEKIMEDNQQLVDDLNKAVNELLEYSKTNEYKVFQPSGLYKIFDKLKEDGIENYESMALCDKEFTEKVELEKFAYDEKMIPNYTGKCTYDTWMFDNLQYNKGEDRYTLIKDKNTNNYYSVKIKFKKTTHYDKEKYYPIFNNSKLLK